MSDDVTGPVSPWREIWDGRLRRSAGLMLAALAFTAGFHIVFSDRLSWADLAVELVLVEMGVLLSGDPKGAATSDATLRWMRGVGQRMVAYGAVAAVAAVAALSSLTPPVSSTPLLAAILALFGLGGVAVILGGSLIYWSSPRVRGWNRNAKPWPRFVAFLVVGTVLAAAGETVLRFRRTGMLDSLHLTGLSLVVAAGAFVLLNLPERVSDNRSLETAVDGHG